MVTSKYLPYTHWHFILFFFLFFFFLLLSSLSLFLFSLYLSPLAYVDTANLTPSVSFCLCSSENDVLVLCCSHLFPTARHWRQYLAVAHPACHASGVCVSSNSCSSWFIHVSFLLLGLLSVPSYLIILLLLSWCLRFSFSCCCLLS